MLVSNHVIPSSTPRFRLSIYGCHIFAVLGHILLYRLTATASIGLIFPSNVALKYPCVPKLSLMNPLRPRRVHNGRLLNHLTSRSLKNM